MPETKIVKDLMVPISEYPVVYEDLSLKEAIIILKNHLSRGKEHRSLMVFSKDKKVGGEERLVSILTVRDILNTIKRNRMIYENTELYTMSWAFFYHKTPLEQYTITRVGQAARPLVKAFLQDNDTVTRAIELMMTQNVNLIPVFRDKKAVGILRALDILDYIGDML
ncbi:CBS domain containing protein [Desulfocucumis palustris]|uniref:CBS domain containing protein n=1 Tax=Desulfocucumis palustris TaxID=1898651 RepID=A0A2L2XEJ5_9FIRM|nr:CBS domain-containing protein [Desulfocucumis palustris]GBF34552.1 CBS domain containing protein [Desulfocucumis palustris]